MIFANVTQRKDKAAPYPLLFWRAICDLGLAVRFIAIPGFNLLICGHLTCTRETAGECIAEFSMFAN